jgi:hypothetical protein
VCVLLIDWQAYHCRNIDYKILIIESMDNDTEMRRLSPVAILSDNKYMDLINGPQDHGWCFGYTCQRRISTFFAVLVSNRNYDIYFTSTPPNQLRFRILNADSNFRVRLSMHYSTSNRVDLYKNSKFVEPTNAEYVNGNMVLRDPQNNLAALMPTVNSSSGTNLMYRPDRKIYFALSGEDVIDLRIAPLVFVRFGVPAITPDSFFNTETLVSNFAGLLNIDPSRIRRVEIVRESNNGGGSGRRRRRQSSSSDDLVYISFTIFENAVQLLSENLTLSNIDANMSQLGARISNLFTTGQLQQQAKSTFNVDLESMSIQQPFSNETAKEIYKAAGLVVDREAKFCREQAICEQQPILKVVDEKVIYFT